MMFLFIKHRIFMKIKNRNELLSDIIKDAKNHPKNWKAVYGKDTSQLSSDYYLFHPHVGLYFLKEYEKNPYIRKGVGGKIARHVDDDLEKSIIKSSSDFGIIQGDIHKIASNISKGVHPNNIIDAAIKGKDMGLRIPLRGKISHANESYTNIKEQLKPSRKKVDTAFEKMAKKEGLYQSYD